MNGKREETCDRVDDGGLAVDVERLRRTEMTETEERAATNNHSPTRAPARRGERLL